jgi:hypothetical protein
MRDLPSGRKECKELVGTLAVAGEVGERGAAVRAQRGEEAAQSAAGNVLKLGGADRGQSNECGDGEGLHVDGWFGIA